ncbi:MAG: hypothetical protein AAF717_15495 [Bacteroidota bacterium]
MTKFTEKAIKKKISQAEKEIQERGFPLANGMIDVHGYTKEEAFGKALKLPEAGEIIGSDIRVKPRESFRNIKANRFV